MADSPGTVQLGSNAVVPALFNPSPSTKTETNTDEVGGDR
jgi:hypothetical protein